MKPRIAPTTYRMSFDILLPHTDHPTLALMLEIAAEGLVTAVRYVHGYSKTSTENLGVLEDTYTITALSPIGIKND
tara:strand:+ start:307 stop:534 length:228 start_codon:yes stop_codon:yes gene_type:complete